MKQEMALTKTSYLAGLIGKDVTAKVPESELKANPNAPKEKSGVIASVNLTGDEPSFRLEGDITDYPLESLLMVRQAGAASATTAAGAAVTAPGASTGTATTAPGASTGATAATAPGASVAAPGTTGSPATAATSPASPATSAPAVPGASPSGITGSPASTENATTASAGSPAGASVPPAVAASSSPSSSEHGPHVAILEREAASPSANNKN